jgi:hypothetical protein
MIKEFLENPNLLIEEYNDLIEVAQLKTFITVGIEIQKEEIAVLTQYREGLREVKKAFIDLNKEKEANLVYCLDGMIRVIQYELEMLVNIKEDQMAEAWGNLVNAQVLLASVIRNIQIQADHLKNHVIKLTNYERMLFPKMNFSSMGGIITESECSICHQDPNECDHLKGKLYMGEVCSTLIKGFDLHEVSVVDNPENKHCRVISFEHDGKKWDALTLREVQN